MSKTSLFPSVDWNNTTFSEIWIRIMEILGAEGFEIRDHSAIPHGKRIDLRCGAIVNVFTTGTIQLQGKTDHHDRLRDILGRHTDDLRWPKRSPPP